jgi:hypothetical protein
MADKVMRSYRLDKETIDSIDRISFYYQQFHNIKLSQADVIEKLIKDEAFRVNEEIIKNQEKLEQKGYIVTVAKKEDE